MDDLPSSPYDRVVSRWRHGGAPPAAADDDVPVRCLDDGHLGPGADAVRAALVVVESASEPAVSARRGGDGILSSSSSAAARALRPAPGSATRPIDEGE